MQDQNNGILSPTGWPQMQRLQGFRDLLTIVRSGQLDQPAQQINDTHSVALHNDLALTYEALEHTGIFGGANHV